MERQPENLMPLVLLRGDINFDFGSILFLVYFDCLVKDLISEGQEIANADINFRLFLGLLANTLYFMKWKLLAKG